MSSSLTSLKTDLHRQSEDERCRDLMYRVLAKDADTKRTELARGVSKMVSRYTTHPATTQLHQLIDGKHAAVVQRTLIVAAAVHEPDFLQYLMEQDDVCTSTLSQYAVDVAPQLVDDLLNGNTDLAEFAVGALHAYTAL